MASITLLLVLICSVICSGLCCSKESICLVSKDENEAECENLSITENITITELSNFIPNCMNVFIYLTSGSHVLSSPITFDNLNQEIQIYGSLDRRSSVICENLSWIQFNMSNKVLISNITFIGCGNNATLYFMHVFYISLKMWQLMVL